jgi:chromosome segregation ATPase
VELIELLNNPMLLAVCAGCFVVGALLMRISSGPRSKTVDAEDPRNHKIRELEADLRTMGRRFDECEQELDAKSKEFETAVGTLQDTKGRLIECQGDLESLKEDLKGSVAKTRELRQELQDRASETIRVNVRADEAETELDVARAGSEAVLSEISRLQEERENMTNTMRHLEESLLPDEDMLGEDSK